MYGDNMIIARKSARNYLTILTCTLMCFSTIVPAYPYLTYLSKFKPNIVLLGENHDRTCKFTNQEHLQELLLRLSLKSEPCYVFVEDRFLSLGGNLETPGIDYTKFGFLSGLTERIDSLGNPNVHTICIEQRFYISKAMAALDPYLITPFSCMYPPEEIARKFERNPYEITFEHLFGEIEHLKNDLLSRMPHFRHMPKAEQFIDSMVRAIDETVAKLRTVLHKSGIDVEASILHTATILRIEDLAAKFPYKKDDLAKISVDIDVFATDYIRSRRMEEFTQRKSELFRRLGEIKSLRSNLEPEPKSNYYKIDKYVFELGLLVVDSHTTLNIIQFSEFGYVVVVAGHRHTERINRYLTKLGYENVSVLDRADSVINPTDIVL